MTFQPVPGVWEVVNRFATASSSQYVNVHHFKPTAYHSPTNTDADAVMAGFAAAWVGASGLDALQITGWSLFETQVTGLDHVGDTQGVSVTSPVTGSESSQALPGQTAAKMDWGTGHIGRSYRGSTFLSGFGEGVSDGFPTSTLQTALQAWGAYLIGAVASALVGNFVIVSRYSGMANVVDAHGRYRRQPVLRSPDAISTPIVVRSTSTRWHTQRQRAF